MSPQGFALSGGATLEDQAAVFINGHRVWSPPKSELCGAPHISWPAALKPLLKGRVRVELRHLDGASVVAAGEATLGDRHEPLDLVDAHGRRLVVTKWGALGVAIDGSDSGLKDRMTARASELIRLLQTGGHQVFLVGGTLLGAMRSGDLLPHDDDMDLGLLAPSDSHPVDLVLLSFELTRLLEGAGYTVVRHSSAHLQVTFLFPDGSTDHYVDIFLAWYRDGCFLEPLAMRVPAEGVTIEPLGSVTLRGLDFPAPADPEGWLAACYGPGWRTPDPSFRFKVPASTNRRFWNWFGDFNVHRSFWEGAGDGGPAGDDVGGLAALFAPGSRVVDLGCGFGHVGKHLADSGLRVLGVDYAFRALAAANARNGLEVRRVNLNDRTDVLDLALLLSAEKGDPSFYLGHTYEGLVGQAKESVLLLLAGMMGEDSVAIFDMDTEVGQDHSYHDPTTWHVETDALRESALRHGLSCEVLAEGVRTTAKGARAWARCRVTLRERRETA